MYYAFLPTYSYHLSVLRLWAVAISEAFLLSVLSFFTVGMENNNGWGFFYFWLMFTLVTMSGTAISRILAYSLPSPDMAQTLGPAALLLFILSACYSPQYDQLPVWLQWLAWISPCAYTYEGVLVSETAFRSVGNMSGIAYSEKILGIPRLPFDSAPPGLDSPGGILSFDAYMLVFITVVLEMIGCVILHQSQKWCVSILLMSSAYVLYVLYYMLTLLMIKRYGPSSIRYQVASGQSLSEPPWKGMFKKKQAKSNATSLDISSNVETTNVPSAPSVHLVAKDIVYEVDVDIPNEEEKEEDDERESLTVESVSDEDEDDTPITAREYGQTGNGALAKFVLSRQGLKTSYMESSRVSRTSLLQTDLDPPDPGRLRLLSGITASFEPGTLNALMGESGAGKKHTSVYAHLLI